MSDLTLDDLHDLAGALYRSTEWSGCAGSDWDQMSEQTRRDFIMKHSALLHTIDRTVRNLPAPGVYGEVEAERARAHEKHGPNSMESYPVGSFIRYTILAEEVGEVAKEFNEAEARGGQHTLDLTRVRGECIQVAAMATAWADRIG